MQLAKGAVTSITSAFASRASLAFLEQARIMPGRQGLQKRGAAGALQSWLETSRAVWGEKEGGRVRDRQVRDIKTHPMPREGAPLQPTLCAATFSLLLFWV